MSDVIVYGENGIDESVVETAARVAEAQENEWKRRGGKGVRYNVYIVSGTFCATLQDFEATESLADLPPCVQTDTFAVFERRFPTLVAIDSHGFTRNKLNFFEREREEMRVLTQASEISENVWVSLTLLGARRRVQSGS